MGRRAANREDILPHVLAMRREGHGRPYILRRLREMGFQVGEKTVRLLLEELDGLGESRLREGPTEAPNPRPLRLPEASPLPRLTRPTVPRRDWAEYPRIPAPAIVLSDTHIPYHDVDWIERVLEEGLKRGIRRVLLAGDIIDARSLAPWPAGDGQHAFEDELELAQDLLRTLAGYFEVHLLPGNHDDRISRRLDRYLSAATLYRYLVPEVRVHQHHHAYVGGTWLVAHPKAYSRTPGQPAYDLAAKYHVNVAIAHTHKWAATVDRSGRYWVVEIGMAAHPRWFEYIHRELRTAPAPQQGALLILDDERPVFLHPRL